MAQENMSMYICTVEYKADYPCYHIHTIKLADLLSCSCEIEIHRLPPTDYDANDMDDYDYHACKTTATTKLCHNCSSKSKPTSNCNSNSDNSDSELLKQVASKHDMNLNYYVGCGVFGSQNIFVGGLKPNIGYGGHAHTSYASNKICVFETNSTVDPNPSIKDLIENRSSFIREMQHAKTNPMLVELNGGNLYALSGYPFRLAPSPTFEVFDRESKRWNPLPDLPFKNMYTSTPCATSPCLYFSYAIVGTKILVSSSTTPVFCFNVADPNSQWKELSSMCNGGPFPFQGRALVLDLEDTDDKVMFAYQFNPKPEEEEEGGHWGIAAYHMLAKNDSIKLLQTDLGPNLPAKFRAPRPYSFVHLGGQKVCFVMASYVRREMEGYGYVKLRLLVITFEFSFSRVKENCRTTSTDDEDSRSFSANILTSRIFEYDCSPELVRDSTGIAELLGCFLLGPDTKPVMNTDNKDSAKDTHKDANYHGWAPGGYQGYSASTSNAFDHGRMDYGNTSMQRLQTYLPYPVGGVYYGGYGSSSYPGFGHPVGLFGNPDSVGYGTYGGGAYTANYNGYNGHTGSLYSNGYANNAPTYAGYPYGYPNYVPSYAAYGSYGGLGLYGSANNTGFYDTTLYPNYAHITAGNVSGSTPGAWENIWSNQPPS